MSQKFKVTEVIPFNDEIPAPILVKFQHKNPITLDTEDDFKWQNTTDDNNKNEKVLIADNPVTGNKYHGIIGEFYSDLVDTYIGVVDKNTNEMCLIQVEQCLMRNNFNDEPAKENDKEVNYSKMLAKEFGSKKFIRSSERKDRMKINLEMVQNKLEESLDLEETIKDDNFEKARALRESSMISMAPIMNSDATDVADIYSIESVLGREFLDLLDDDAIAVLKSNPNTLPLQENILLSTITAMQQSKKPDSPENLDKTKAIIYMDALANIINSGKTRINKSTIFTDMSEEVNKHIHNNFSAAHLSINLNTRFTLHKALCYFIVLALLLTDKRRINVDEITKIINYTKTNLTKFVKRIGGFINLSTNMIQLKKPGSENNDTKVSRKRKYDL